MSDNKKKKGYQDDAKVDTKDPNEMAYRKKQWGVSTQQITGAVKAVGSSGVKKIEKYLKDNGKI